MKRPELKYIYLSFLAIMLVAVAIPRTYLYFEKRIKNDTIIRIESIVENTNNIFNSSIEQVLVFGASHVWFGFQPRVFEEEVRNLSGKVVRALNLGVPLFAVKAGAKLVQHFNREAEKRSYKFSVVFVEVDPNVLTIARTRKSLDNSTWQQITAIPDISTWRELFFTSQNEFWRQLAYKIFFDSVNPSEISNFFSNQYLTQPSWWPVKKSSEKGTPFRRILRNFFDQCREYDSKAYWNIDEGGAWPYHCIDAKEEIAQLWLQWHEVYKDKDVLDRTLRTRESAFDGFEYKFDTQLVDIQIILLQTIKKIADKVIPILPPIDTRLMPNDIGEQNIQKLKELIKLRTDLEIVDMRSSAQQDDFFDFDHLLRKGAIKWSKKLASVFVQ